MKNLRERIIEALLEKCCGCEEEETSVKTIASEKDFRSMAENKFNKVFGDKLDRDKMNKIIDGIIKDHKNGSDWGEAIGTLNKSFGK